MTVDSDTIFVTGGAGFIGAHLVESLIGLGHRVVNLDALTYAGNLDNLALVRGSPRHIFVHDNICNRQVVTKILRDNHPALVINIAAETHVDRSIDDAARFIETNVRGVFDLLECSLDYWRKLNGYQRDSFRFIQMSTDEVYGSIGEGAFTEDSNYAPNSPYAASKAAGDHMTRAYRMTYGLPTIIARASNTYGPRQFPEKLIPHTIISALGGRPLAVYGDGYNVRDWLYVGDLVAGLQLVIERGRAGEVYNFAGGEERRNIDTVRTICAQLDRLRPADRKYENGIAFVKDRPGHDFRYAMSVEKVTQTFGWSPKVPLQTGLVDTVEWYLANRDWCQAVLARGYDGARIGTKA